MGKTFRRDSQYRPRKAGRVFSKEPPKKKSHPRPPLPNQNYSDQ